MCARGRQRAITIPDKDGRPRWVQIDSCISQLVWAINAGGIRTVSSCCGHGEHDGYIIEERGRVLVVQRGRSGGDQGRAA